MRRLACRGCVGGQGGPSPGPATDISSPGRRLLLGQLGDASQRTPARLLPARAARLAPTHLQHSQSGRRWRSLSPPSARAARSPIPFVRVGQSQGGSPAQAGAQFLSSRCLSPGRGRRARDSSSLSKEASGKQRGTSKCGYRGPGRREEKPCRPAGGNAVSVMQIESLKLEKCSITPVPDHPGPLEVASEQAQG